MRHPSRASPLIVLTLCTIGAAGLVKRTSSDRSDSPATQAGAAERERPPTGDEGGVTDEPPEMRASDFCVDVGYLCAGLVDEPRIVLRRWAGHEGTLIVHVPLPDGEEPTVARALQRAAAQGIRVWNNHPFPILADLRGDRGAHFTVQWVHSLSGMQIGRTRTTWSPESGLGVLALELATRQPANYQTQADPQQLRLTAAHEMGHALGLPHSDAPRDVMYPTNTATAMSAQDYRSIEVLYATPDGTVVRR